MATAIAGNDGTLRAGLIGALTLGAITGRDLLQLEGVRDADPERIVSLLRPATHALAHGTAEPAARTSR